MLNIPQSCLTRSAHQPLLGTKPECDSPTMLRTDGEKTIGTAHLRWSLTLVTHNRFHLLSPSCLKQPPCPNDVHLLTMDKQDPKILPLHVCRYLPPAFFFLADGWGSSQAGKR